MSAMDVGKRLVDLCSQGKNMDAIDELYAEGVISVEAMAPEGGARESKGIEAVRGKNTWWTENHEIHSASVDGPFPHGDDRFAAIFEFDVTARAEPMAGQRFRMKEVALYRVENGKVTHEEFFYTMG